MRRSRKYASVVLVVALVIAMAVTGCTKNTTTSTPSTTETKATYKIGAIVSLTGTYAGLGTPEKNTIDMEVKRINDAGGVNGHPIEVIIEDDATDAAKAVQAAAKLIDQNKVLAIMGATGTGQTMGFRKNVDDAKIPNMSMAGGTVITVPLDPYVFQTPWSNTLVVPFELAFMKKQGITKIGVISDSGGFGKDGAGVLASQVGKFGIKITSNQTFNVGDTDMTPQLTLIKNSGAQAIVMWTAGKEASTIAKNREQLKITLPFFGSHGNALKDYIKGAGSAANGTTFAAGKVLIPSTYGTGTPEYTVATDFIARYKAAYGIEPNTFAGHAYDALNITVEAMKRLPEGFTPQQLRDEIEKTQGYVGIGGTFNYSATDHNGLTEKDLVMYRVANEDWTLVK